MKRYVVFAYDHEHGGAIIDYLAAESDAEALGQNARKREAVASTVWIGTIDELRQLAAEADAESDDTLQREMNEYLD